MTMTRCVCAVTPHVASAGKGEHYLIPVKMCTKDLYFAVYRATMNALIIIFFSKALFQKGKQLLAPL